MSHKVLVVDDSAFYRKRLVAFLGEDPFIDVIGQAKNGKEAVEMAVALQPDAITMDVEMPGMDGITAVTEIMRKCPTAILMLSAVTQRNAKATLDALAAGALDYMPKNVDDIFKKEPGGISKLKHRVKVLARKNKDDKKTKSGHLSGSRMGRFNADNALKRAVSSQQTTPSSASKKSNNNAHESRLQKRIFDSPVASSRLVRPSGKKYGILALGASTGGPQALQAIIDKLPADFPYPVVIVQHMPETFTSAFAKRLDTYASIKVKLAENGDILTPGCAYLAPGGVQMKLVRKAQMFQLVVEKKNEKDDFLFKPSIDYTFTSIAECFAGEALALILTGMGDDGTKGAARLREKGASVWVQDEESSVVYGMPKSVYEAGYAQRVVSLSDMAHDLLIEMKK